MSNSTEVIFDNIEQRILKEIEDAHYAIFVSVAWFTNKKLFNALLDKAKDNCYISIIIQLDDINSQSGIDYSQIRIGRSECFEISKDTELLHDKFCVIDFKKVITGSYNWTYKASANSENIVIILDPNIATQYITRFEIQKNKYTEFNIQTKTSLCNNLDNKNNRTPNPSHIAIEVQTQEKFKNSCGHMVEKGDLFCRLCGTPITAQIVKRIVLCKDCNHEQTGAFIDANNTKYCIYCGSNNIIFKKQ
ncbi:MAG: DUF1669 domain-containing protein [Bacteroidaceae bacterium]|nr:DUF1669 domain-containing protein [Bacteroidaceae bacterium]